MVASKLCKGDPGRWYPRFTIVVAIVDKFEGVFTSKFPRLCVGCKTRQDRLMIPAHKTILATEESYQIHFYSLSFYLSYSLALYFWTYRAQAVCVSTLLL